MTEFWGGLSADQRLVFVGLIVGTGGALIGTILGSLLTQAGNLIMERARRKHDRDVWDREDAIRRESWAREERIERERQRRHLYARFYELASSMIRSPAKDVYPSMQAAHAEILLVSSREVESAARQLLGAATKFRAAYSNAKGDPEVVKPESVGLGEAMAKFLAAAKKETTDEYP